MAAAKWATGAATCSPPSTSFKSPSPPSTSSIRREGATHPKMMFVGLHYRIIGKPAAQPPPPVPEVRLRKGRRLVRPPPRHSPLVEASPPGGEGAHSRAPLLNQAYSRGQRPQRQRTSLKVSIRHSASLLAPAGHGPVRLHSAGVAMPGADAGELTLRRRNPQRSSRKVRRSRRPGIARPSLVASRSRYSGLPETVIIRAINTTITHPMTGAQGLSHYL